MSIMNKEKQYCEWKFEEVFEEVFYEGYQTVREYKISCRKENYEDCDNDFNYCPYCGKEIKIKDGE